MSQQNVVYIIEDDEGVRQSLSRLMAAEGYEIASFSTGREFLNTNPLAQQACLILDFRLPDMSGLELQALLASRGIKLPIIIISGFGDIPLAVKAMKSGAIDFLQKPFDTQELMDCVREAFASNAQASAHRRKQSDAAARLSRLSRREREVMDLVVLGMASKNIAEKLGLRVKTVENHRAHLKKKLGVDSVAELVQLAFLDRAPDTASSGKAKSLHLVPVMSK